MLYRLRVILDNDTKDDIFRDLEIIKESTLKDLNELILLAFKFNGAEMSSFFTVDDEWNQIDEISLLSFDNSTKSMDSEILSDFLNRNNKKLLYIYDFMSMWTFYIELIEEGKSIIGKKYPRIIFSNGDMPSEAPKKLFEQNNTEENEEDDFLY